MSLHLYDTASRSAREFVPIEPGRCSIYLCGATVQAPPHVGHIRSGVSFDVLRRWLMASGLDVDFVRNVTDIDDKIIHNAGHEDVGYWVVAMRNERAFNWAYDVLGCLPPTYEPRATGHIPEMIVFMQRLIDAGHAYASNGDVYFDVRSYAEYGALSRQKLDDMYPAGDSDAAVKKDPRDFALWKGAKPGEPQWETPWGPGRPGWHLECSAMARKYLGEQFDIHGGGLDLVFPHHENEIAQSKAAGDAFANFWLHNAWVTTAGEKMSKSLGNSLLVSQIVKDVRPVELRYYLASAHYRSMIEFSFEALSDAGSAYRRIESFIARATERTGVPDISNLVLPQDFIDAMNDDLGVPQALAVLHDAVRTGNSTIEAGDITSLSASVHAVLSMLDVLGLNPFAGPWVSSGGADEALRQVVDALVAGRLQARNDARAQRDFAAADSIRDELKNAGVAIEDTPDGPRWSLAESR